MGDVVCSLPKPQKASQRRLCHIANYESIKSKVSRAILPPEHIQQYLGQHRSTFPKHPVPHGTAILQTPYLNSQEMGTDGPYCIAPIGQNGCQSLQDKEFCYKAALKGIKRYDCNAYYYFYMLLKFPLRFCPYRRFKLSLLLGEVRQQFSKSRFHNLLGRIQRIFIDF